MASKNKSKKAIPATQNFISFSDVVSTPSSTNSNIPESVFLQPVYIGKDSELSAACKQVFKKDSITRLKAFQAIRSILDDRGNEVIHDFISHFVYIYIRIILDNQRQIVESLNSILLLLISTNRPSFKPYMRDLVGPWWVFTLDIYSKGAEISTQAFDKAFPSEKNLLALKSFSSSILETIVSNLELSKTSIDTAEENAEEYLERVYSVTLSALGKLVSLVPSEFTSLDSGSPGSFLSSPSFWSKWLASQSASIRGQVYGLLRAVASHAILPPSSIDTIGKAISKSLMDPHGPNTSLVYDSFITFSKSYPSLFNNYSIDKHLTPSLRKTINNDPMIAFSYFLPILASIPESMVSTSGHAVSPIVELLRYIIDGLNSNRIPMNLTIDGCICVLECGCFVSLRKQKIASDISTDNTTNITSLFQVIADCLVLFLDCLKENQYEKKIDEVLPYMAKLISKLHAASVGADTLSGKCNELIWKPFSEHFLARTDEANEHSYSILLRFTSIMHLVINSSPAISNERGLSIVLNALMMKCTAKIKQSSSVIESFISTSILTTLNINLHEACDFLGSTLSVSLELTATAFEKCLLNTLEYDYFIEKLLTNIFTNLTQYATILGEQEILSTKIRIVYAILKSRSLQLVVNLFDSHYCHDLILDSESCDIIEKMFSDIINGSKLSSNKVLIMRYLYLCTTLPLIDNRNHYIQGLQTKWKETNSSICLWTLLTLYANNDCSTTISNDNIESLLTSAFFGRNRDSNRGMDGTKAHKQSTTYSMITTWNDIKTSLFPKLPSSLTEGFARNISIQLKACLSLSKSINASENAADEDNDSATGLQPKKFARHVCGLMSLSELQYLGSYTSQQLLSTIGLVDTEVWQVDSVSLIYIDRTFVFMSEIWEGNTALIWSIFLSNPATYLDAYMILKPHENNYALTAIHNLLHNLDSSKLLEFTLGVLDAIVDKSFENSSCPRSVLTEGILSDILSVTNDSIQIKSSGCILHTPLPSDVLIKESKIWYLRTVASGHTGAEEVTAGVQAVESTVVHVDRQTPEKPFYTIVYKSIGSGDVEVQTESHRLLLSAPMGNFDAVGLVSENISTSHEHAHSAIVFSNWILNKISDITTKSAIDKDSLLDTVGPALLVFGYMSDENTEYSHAYRTHLAPAVRKIILTALSKDFLSCSNEIFTGFSILKHFITCKSGIGHGLWIPQVLECFRKFISSLNTASRLILQPKERSQGYVLVSSALSKLLNVVQSRDGVEQVLIVIPILLASLSQDSDGTAASFSDTTIQLTIVDCFSHVWESKSVQYGIKGHGKSNLKASAGLAAENRATKRLPNELTVFNIALNLLGESGSSIEMRLSAARALHYCYLEKDRNESKELLAASAISSAEETFLTYVSDVTEHPIIRLFAAKSLDIFYLSKEVILDEVMQEEPVDEESMSDAVELEKDRVLFLRIVGSTLYEILQTKLSQQSKTYQSIGQEQDLFGFILEWLLCLQLIDVAAAKSFTIRCRCANYLKKSGLLNLLMLSILRSLPDQTKISDIAHLFRKIEAPDEQPFGASKLTNFSMLVVYCLFRTVYTLPAIVRSWWSDESTREHKSLLRSIIEGSFSNSIAAREVAIVSIAAADGKWTADEMIVKGSAISGEVVATYLKDGVSIELKIKLPSAYPLLNVEVECSSKVGVSDARWKRWVLQIVQLLSMQDGSVADAVLILKKNIDKEFEGVEPCPICYSILHPKSMALPSLACPTCSNKFHNQCLFTWFKSSGKSKCVICQQPFFL